MGGRRSSSGNTVKTVSYEKWGKMWDGADRRDVRDENGDVVGHIEDVVMWNSVEDIQKATLAEAKREIDAWLNDKDNEYGWTHGDDDVHIFVAYSDGTQISDDELNGKKFKKSGIIGVSVSTGDYELVVGDEWVNRSGQRIREPIQTWSEDGKSGLTNVWSGYKSTEKWIERVETTYNNPVYDKDGNIKRYQTKRRVLRRSTRVPLNNRGM